jgi:stage IV sporulation protein B
MPLQKPNTNQRKHPRSEFMPKKWPARLKKTIGCLLAAAVLVLNYSAPVLNFFNLPDEIDLQQGQIENLNIGFPLPLTASDTDVLQISSESLGAKVWQKGSSVELMPQACGMSQIKLSLFGFIPVKSIVVHVTPQMSLIPGGESVGVSLFTAGTLVVGRSDVVTQNGEVKSPARDADLRPGDVIQQINGIDVENSSQFANLVAKYGDQPLRMTVDRDGQTLQIDIRAVRDQQDGKLRLGIWIRDSTAGVGTLTFYNPADGRFGALGHPITDVDTGTLLSVKNGEIVLSKIVDVKIGEKGAPGELRGYFPGDGIGLGTIDKNTKFGIFGNAYGKIANSLYPQALPVGGQATAHTGPAKILTTIDDEGVKEFECNIIKVTRQEEAAAKGMVIEITDKTLIEKTGGIVQGMSGSPIIQDGYIIGAVTHVFINDPTKGHGVFIEWMLENSKSIN